MKFNEKLIELRKKQGLSQEELGYKLNVTRQTVSKWELGQTTPEMDKLIEISKIFSVSVDELTNDSEITTNVNPIIEDQPILEKKPRDKKILIIIVIALIAITIYVGVQIFSAFFGFKAFDKMKDEIVGTQEDAVPTEAKNFWENFFGNIFGLFDKAIDMQKEQLDNNSNNYEEGKEMFDNVLEEFNENNIETNVKDVIEEESITNNIQEFSDFDKRMFNSSYEVYAGSSNGSRVKIVIDKVITNNKTEERKITVKYNDIETLNEEEIRNIKRNFETFDECEIIYEYDENGFINKVIIEKY